MTGKLKAALDAVTAENSLKEKTLASLTQNIRAGKQSRTRGKRLAATFAAAAIFLIGIFGYNQYYAVSAYLAVDVNPSLTLSINRFDKVISVYAYNSGGELILSGLRLKHRDYQDALNILIEELGRNEYLTDGGLVTVTLQTDESSKEISMLSVIKRDVETTVHSCCSTMRIDVFPVNASIRRQAHGLNLSPAKYLAILALQEADPSVTIESCMDRSIDEINRLTQSHKSGHHGGKHD